MASISRLRASLRNSFSESREAFMQREPWIHFWGVTTASTRSEILDCLQQCGTTPRTLDVNAPTGEGILFFSVVDEDLYDFVREISRDREERVLVVPLTEDRVEISNTW